MPLQLFLPGFPEGSVKIGATLSILKKDGRVNYFTGSDNYFSHIEGDVQSHRFILATLMENGYVRPRDLENAPLCIPHRTLMNWTAQLREKGSDSFFRSTPHPGARVITPGKAVECAGLLTVGKSIADVAEHLCINISTLRKAIKRGAIPTIPEAPGKNIEGGTTKSDRSRQDA